MINCRHELLWILFLSGFVLGIFSGYKIMKPSIEEDYVLDVVTIITKKAVMEITLNYPKVPFGAPIQVTSNIKIEDYHKGEFINDKE